MGPSYFKPKKQRAINSENTIGSTGYTEDIINKSDSVNFYQSNGNNQQVVATKMNDGTGDKQSKYTSGNAA